MRKINEIIVHCSATPEGRDVTVKTIDKWHKDRGWKGIGYHWVIYRDGSVHKGRAENAIGAHCKGHNAHSIGIVYIGGMDKAMKKPKDTRTKAQKDAIVKLILELKSRYHGIEKVSGHRDYAAKACPSYDATTEYKDIFKPNPKPETELPDQVEDVIEDAAKPAKESKTNWYALLAGLLPAIGQAFSDWRVQIVMLGIGAVFAAGVLYRLHWKRTEARKAQKVI